MANKQYCIYETVSREIAAFEDQPDDIATADILANAQTDYGATVLDIFEITADMVEQFPDPQIYKVNATADDFELRTIAGTNDDIFFEDPSAPLNVPPYFQWNFYNGPYFENMISDDIVDGGGVEFPKVGAPLLEQYNVRQWTRELVDEGNSLIPTNVDVTIQSIPYTAPVDEILRFDAFCNTRESTIFSYVAGSVISSEMWLRISETFGGAVVYQSSKQMVATVRDDSLDRQAFVDTGFVKFEATQQYTIELISNSRFLAGAGGSTLGLATESFKLTRQVIG